MTYMVDDLFVDFGHTGLNKHDESLCGDFFTEAANGDEATIVLSDGLGSGVKANILATLTSKILSTMMSKKLPIEEAVYTVASTLPVCKVRKMAYSTFTILQFSETKIYLAQYDNPAAIILRNGKNLQYSSTKVFLFGKEIYESTIKLQKGDLILLFTDGVINAGIGKTTDNGWSREDIIKFCEDKYTPELSASRMATYLLEACRALYLNETDDDTTILAFKVKERKAVNMIIGPPKDQETDNSTLRLFFSKAGKHVVCGGTTAGTVCRYLQKPLTVLEDTATDELPAMSQIEGVDLVTEGIITLHKLEEYACNFVEDNSLLTQLDEKVTGASSLAHLLFEEASDINIFFGSAVNEAHEDDIDFVTKMSLMRSLEQNLIKMGKNVKISIC